MIRVAQPGDATAIAAIWNQIIAETTATFTTTLKDEPGLRALIDARGVQFVVATNRDVITGFATYSAFRNGPGYAATVEHSVMVSGQAKGQGVGRALMQALEDQARRDAVHVMVAGISGENTDAIAFHVAMGFGETARMPEVGRKFGRWLDLVCMQKIL